MDTVTVVARETFTYAGITQYVGRTFEVTVEDARILKLVGKVADVEAPDTRRESRRLEQPVESTEPAEPDDLPKPRRTYRRRDLTAEEPCNSSD